MIPNHRNWYYIDNQDAVTSWTGENYHGQLVVLLFKQAEKLAFFC